MPIPSDKALADALRRDGIADGDAARDYARTHDLSADWIYEMTKRLMIELERRIKKIEDDHSVSQRSFNEHAAALDKYERTLARVSNTQHGKAVLEQAEAEAQSNDTRELTELARRLAARNEARGKAGVS